MHVSSTPWAPCNDLCVQLELVSSEEKALTLQSRCGDQRAGLTLHVKSFPLNREIRGTVLHSWPWLRDRGLPLHAEVLSCIDVMSHNPHHWGAMVCSFYCWQKKLLCFSSVKGPVLPAGRIISASAQDSAQGGRTEAAHIWLEYQRCWWTCGCSPLLLPFRCQPDEDTTSAGGCTDGSVQRSVSVSVLGSLNAVSYSLWWLNKSAVVSTYSCVCMQKQK